MSTSENDKSGVNLYRLFKHNANFQVGLHKREYLTAFRFLDPENLNHLFYHKH